MVHTIKDNYRPQLNKFYQSSNQFNRIHWFVRIGVFKLFKYDIIVQPPRGDVGYTAYAQR